MNSLLVKRTHFLIDGEIPPPQRPWLPLVLSGILHLLVIAAIVMITRKEAQKNLAAQTSQPQPERRVDLVTLPPYQPPSRRAVELPKPPVPSPHAAEPPPDRMPRPQVKRGEHLDEEVTVAPEPPPERGPLGVAPWESRVESQESREQLSTLDSRPSTELAMVTEAQRLFGRPQHGVTNATGPEPNARWAQEVTDDRDNDCRPSQRPPKDPDAPVEMGQVSGQVFREGSSQPLAGAFLQILGTPYSTFADDNGWYTLSFDQSLVDACRTQYVQVSKDGFRPRRLILGLGARANNNIPMSRR
jgi:hypothetical protein